MASCETDLYRRALERFDRLIVRRAMDIAEGQQFRAAEILGISRVTLRAKLRSLGMHIGKALTQKTSDKTL